jgi:predicted AlkP superfamily phosphohydrolase/phosphomutase
MDQECMPHLAEVARNGLAVDLASVVPPITAAAWTSFMTGKHPGKHGIFDFTAFDPGTGTWRVNNATNIRSKTVWQLLSEKEKRVVVLGLPYIYPPYPVEGILVSGWDAPSLQGNFTYPTSLINRILEEIPDFGSTSDLSFWKFLPTDSWKDFHAFLAKLRRSFEQQFDLAQLFLDSESWDVFMVHFQQTDWIQHKLWSYIAKACADPSDKSARVAAIRDYYRRLDELVGALINSVDASDTLTIVLSDHGFGADFGTICVNYYLRKWGYLHVAAKARQPLKDLFRNSRLATVRSLYGRLASIKHRLDGEHNLRKHRSWAEELQETTPRQKLLVDWPQTRAVLLGSSETGFVYVNEKGRWPNGVVEPGVEYEHLLAELTAHLSQILHPVTGSALIKHVSRGAEVYPEASEGIWLPDLVLFPAEGYTFSSAWSQAVTKGSREGCHRSVGILLAEGTDVRVTDEPVRPCLLDLAPTILHLSGLPVPSDMDGHVLINFFDTPQPVTYITPENLVPLAHKKYTAEESAAIEQRLKDLGYLE